MDGFIIRSIGLGVLLPAVLAGVIALFGRAKLGAWAGAIGVTVGFVAGYIGVQGMPPFVPRTVPELLPALAVVGLLWAYVERFWLHSSTLTWLLRLVPLALLELFLYFRIFSGRITARFNPWTTGDIILNLAVPAVTVALLWVFLALALPPAAKAAATDASNDAENDNPENYTENNNAENNNAPKRSLAVLVTVLIVLCSGVAVSLVLAGSAIVAQIVGALTAALGAVMVLAWFAPAPYVSLTAAPVIALVLGNALSLGGFFAATLPWYVAILLAVTALFLYVGHNRPFVMRLAVQLGGTAVLAAISAFIAFRTH